jgi:ADP-L-glycero-D-manno-heptose 6-epimerase
MAIAQTYLVTGAAGFIGSQMVKSIQSKGHMAVCVDRLSHFKDRKEHSKIDFGTPIDRDELFQWLRTDDPHLKAVVHLGACTDTTQTDTEYLKKTNTEYSQTLWTYCTKMKIPFYYASSAATYGGGENGYNDDPKFISKLKPLNAYGHSKQAFDLWVLDQIAAGLHPPLWAGFKFFNVYGYGERHKGKMSSVVLQAYDQIKKTDQVRLFKSHKSGIADGEQKRDFISVDDVVSVLHFALDHPIEAGIFNLGTGKARSFLDLARCVFKALGKKEHIEFIDTPASLREHYQYFTQATMDRLTILGYSKPFQALEEGIAKYLEQL